MARWLRLEQRGWIEPLPAEDRRRPYRLSATGAEVLRSQLESMQRVARVGLKRLPAASPGLGALARAMTIPLRRLLIVGIGLLAAVGIVLLAGAAIFRPTPARVLSAARVEPTVVANDPATRLLERGDSAFENGDYAAAITAYTDALALNPNFAEAYNDRGIAYYRRDELDRAIADYERALALRPDYVNALTNHAVAIFDRAAYDTVIAETSRAIALDPADDLAFVYRGNAYQRKGDYERALGDWLAAQAIRTQRQAGGY